MLKSLLASFLAVTILILTIPPRAGRAQNHAKPTPSNGEHIPAGSLSKPGPDPDLKSRFASELRDLKAGTLTSADVKKIQQNSQTPKDDSKFGRKQKIFLALFVVLMTGLVVVLIKHPCREKKPGDCDFIYDDPYAY
jgi:hypothetical protein